MLALAARSTLLSCFNLRWAGERASWFAPLVREFTLCWRQTWSARPGPPTKRPNDHPTGWWTRGHTAITLLGYSLLLLLLYHRLGWTLFPSSCVCLVQSDASFVCIMTLAGLLTLSDNALDFNAPLQPSRDFPRREKRTELRQSSSSGGISSYACVSICRLASLLHFDRFQSSTDNDAGANVDWSRRSTREQII